MRDDNRHGSLRAFEASFAYLSVAINALSQARTDLRRMDAGPTYFDKDFRSALSDIEQGIELIARGQAKIPYVIKRIIDKTTLAWCGHEYPDDGKPTCKCGPAPF